MSIYPVHPVNPVKKWTNQFLIGITFHWKLELKRVFIFLFLFYHTFYVMAQDNKKEIIEIKKDGLVEIELFYKMDMTKFRQSYKPIGIGLIISGATITLAGFPIFVYSLVNYYGDEILPNIRTQKLALFCVGIALEITGLAMIGMSIPLFVIKKSRINNNSLKSNISFEINCLKGIYLGLCFKL